MPPNLTSLFRKILPGEFIHQANLLIHQGDRFICPICYYSSSGLAQIGTDSKANREQHIIGAGLRNAGCYKCGSTDRDRLMYLYLRDELKLFQGDQSLSMLHIAPEKNVFHLLRKVNNLHYTAGDTWIDKHGYYKGIEQIDIREINYPDNSFDIIVCNHVLEHIVEDQKAMTELYRVLKPGGKAVLQVPFSERIKQTFEDSTIIDKNERLEFFGQHDHVRIYGPDYPLRLEAAGFKVDVMDFSHNTLYSKYGLNPEEKLFVGSKKVN